MNSCPLIPPISKRFGFSTNRTGGHMARSMMLSELAILARALPRETTRPEYRTAILTGNLLGKPTFSSRENSFRHLVELYGLDPQLALFRVLRTLTTADPASLPLVAMTCAFCRDAQLRHSFALIETLKPGEALARERMEEHLETGFPGRFSPAMKQSLARNVNTTWTVAGHLAGRSHKRRAVPTARMVASVYALFAGYLLGLRGEILLQSVFARLVAPDAFLVAHHLAAASARGWLRFRQGGGVVEIDCSPLLTAEEREWLHDAD
jgi:hypothetical protein